MHCCTGQDRLDQLCPDLLLYRAARSHNLPVMLEAIALGADTEFRCSLDGELVSCLVEFIRIFIIFVIFIKETVIVLYSEIRQCIF